ncbi:MAG TPA: addiction module protein [Tepidisphaeraceae bacterium]|nr:addiction module protein [Tepidisphaeraceae bacterium]
MAVKQTVIQEVMNLPESERLELAEALYQSVEGPSDPDARQAWSDEIARRLEKIDSGRGKVVPWEEARRQIAGDDASS